MGLAPAGRSVPRERVATIGDSKEDDVSTTPGSDEAALEYSYKYNPQMDLAVAEESLKEAKEILDRLGVSFILSSGTVLGAIRHKGFIPWDDDVDFLSVIGHNGTTEESADIAVAAFRANGYFAHFRRGAGGMGMSMIRNHLRIGWDFYRVVDEHVVVYPGIRLPIRLFDPPKEIDFMGGRFLVPNPPEEYLRLKYGEEWMVPKRAGVYERDIVEKIPPTVVTGRPCRLRVLDHNGEPVPGAEVVLAGGGRSTADGSGYAEVILPGPDFYALTIRYRQHEEVLYMEIIEPGATYVYRPDPAAPSGRGMALTRE